MANSKDIVLDLPEDVKKWWESVQKTLTDAGYELSLSNPADLARFFTVSFEREGYDNYAVKTYYAFDPLMQEIDVNTITEEEILARQAVNQQSMQTAVESAYRQAKQGLLFIRSVAGDPAQTRQLLVGEDGTAELGNDIDHPSPEEREYTRMTEAPEPPAEPGQAVRDRAAAGNESAQITLRLYEENVAEYPHKVEEWNAFQAFVAQKPEFYSRCRNMVITFRNYLVDKNRDFHEYTKKLEKLHNQTKYDQYPEEERTVVMNRDRQNEVFRANLSDFFAIWDGRKMKYGAWGSSLSEYFARMLVARAELKRGEEALANGAGKNFIPLDEDQTEAAVGELMNSQSFKDMKLMLAQDDFTAILNADQKAAVMRSRIEQFCDSLITAEGREELRTGWWGRLQEALDRAGCELDLNSAEDLSRLLVFDVQHTGYNAFSALPHFAADPEKTPIDLKTLNEEGIRSASRPGVPDEETMRGILQAAYEGRLFVLGHKGAAKPALPRPILLNNTSLPVVGADMNGFSEGEMAVLEVMEAPEAPEDPGSWDRMMAKLGNREASERVAVYNRKQAEYERKSAAWDRIQHSDPRFTAQVRNRYLIGQTYFANPENGKELQRFEEMTSKLHRQYEVSKLPEENRPAAADINRHRERMVTLIGSTFVPLQKAHLLDEGAPLSADALTVLSQLLASRQEISRAERSMGDPNYRPRTEQEMIELGAEIRKRKLFRQVADQFNGDFLDGLIRNADRGELETEKFLDQRIEHAVDNAVKDPELEELRRSLLNREGTKRDLEGSGRGYYSVEMTQYLNQRLCGYINEKVPGKKALVPGDNVILNKEQAEYLRERGCADFVSLISNDPLQFTATYSRDAIKAFTDRMRQNYQPLTDKEKKERAENSAAIREKFNLYMAERYAVSLLATREGARIPRAFLGLLKVGTDPVSLAANEEIRRVVTAGTLEEKRALYMDAFRELEALDMTGIDVMDDGSLIENFDKLRPVLTTGVEMTNLLQGASEVGIDLTGEAYKPLIEKLGIIADTSYMMRARIDAMSHPMYAELRYESFRSNYQGMMAVDVNGEDVDVFQFFADRGEVNRAASGSISQIGMIAHLADSNPLFDVHLSPEDRVKNYRETFWNSAKEVMPKKPEVIYRRGELLEDDEDHYNDFAEDAELEGMKEPETSEELIKELGAEAQNMPELPQAEPDPLAAERAEYKEKFLANMALIREIVPDFQLSEQEIDAYLTDARIMLHKDSKALSEKVAAADAELKDLPSGPASFARLWDTFYDLNGTEEAAERNSALKEAMISFSPEVNEQYRLMAAELINNVVLADPSRTAPDQPIEEAGRYALENRAAIGQGMDIGYFTQNIASSLGFSVSREKREYLDRLRDKGEALGMANFLNKLTATEAFLTIPFEHLTAAQCVKLISAVAKKNEKALPVEKSAYEAMFNYVNAKQYYQPAPEIEPQLFTAREFYDNKVRSLAEAKENFRSLSGKLQNDGTEQFDSLREALRRLDEALDNTEGYIDTDRSSALGQCFHDVYRASFEYERYLSGKEELSPAEEKTKYYVKSIYDFSEPYRKGMVYFKSLIDEHNRSLTEAYYENVKLHPENAEAKHEGADVEAAEKLFAEGLKRTEALRAEVERLDEAEVPEAEDLFRLEAGRRILEAREKLTQMVGRDNITADELLQPMAEIIQGNRALQLFAEKPDGMKSYRLLTAYAMEDPAFKELLRGFGSDEVNSFLAGPGEEALREGYLKNMLPGDAENAAPELPKDPAFMYNYDRGLQQTAYAEAADRFAEALHEKLNELYAPLEKNTALSLNRMHYITVEDQSLATLFYAEHDKLPQAERPLNPNGTSMTGEQMLQSYGLAQAEHILAEALLKGQKVSYFTVDPETAQINGKAALPLELEDIGLSPLDGMRDEEQEAAFTAADRLRSEAADPVQEVRRRAENEQTLIDLNYFYAMGANSVFSTKTKKAYFGNFEQESGTRIALLNTAVVGTKSRGGASSLAAAALVCRGYRIEDVFDPTKLLAEKDEIGRETVAHLLANDAEWVADINLRGRDILGADLMKRAEKVDFTDPKSIFTEENKIMGQEALMCFDLSQDINNEYTKREKPEWYRKNCGSMTPADKEKQMDARSMIMASFIGSFFTAQEKLLETAAGINTLPLQNGLSRDIAGVFLEQRRKENPEKAIDGLISLEEQAILAPDPWLDMTSPEAARELRRMKQTDSRGLAKSILDGSFLKKYKITLTAADGIVMPVLSPSKALGQAAAADELAADEALQSGRNRVGLSAIAEEENADIDTEFSERMEQYRTAGIENLSVKQRLEEIRGINEDLKAAGIKPMSEEEMLERASDPKLIRDCMTASAFCGRINRTYEFQDENKKTGRYKVHEALGRSLGYLMDTSGTEEAEEKNRETEARLQTVEDVNRVIREAFRTMMEIDESKLFAEKTEDMIAVFGDDPQKLQLIFELNHIMDTVKTVKKEDGAEVQNTYGLEPGEYDQLQEKYKIFEDVAGFEHHIRMDASPLNLFMPKLSPEDTRELMMYYARTGQTEKYEYISSAMATSIDSTEEKYAPTVAGILKEAGFLGLQEPDAHYETFDDNGELLSSRRRGITLLSDGTAKSIRFVKHMKKADGAGESEEITLNRSDIVKLYDRAHLDERLDQAYRPLSKVIFTSDPAVMLEQQEAAKKGLPVKKVIFSGDPMILEAQKAALLFELSTSAFKEADRLQQEELYQRCVDELADGRNARVDYLCSQTRETMDAMLCDFAATDREARMKFILLFGEAESDRKSLEEALIPGERAIKGMFLPKTDSAGMRIEFADRLRGPYISSEMLNAQRKADAVTVPVPEGMSEENVTAAIMSCFFTEEICKESYRLNFKDNDKGSTQYKEDVVDIAMGGFNNIIDNTIVKDDSRENVQRGRLLLPEARQKAKTLMEAYEAGNTQALAEAADESLRFLVGQYNHFVGRDSANLMVCGRILTGVYDLISRPELKEYSRVLKDVPEEWFESVKLDMQLNREKAELRDEISAALRQKAIEAAYLGKDTDREAAFAEDTALKEKILDYEARRLYFDQIRAANEVFQEAKRTELGGDTVKLSLEARKRPLSRSQKNMLHNPEAYIRFLKEQIQAGNMADYGNSLKAATWEDARSSFSSQRRLFYTDAPMNLGYAETGILATTLRNFLEHAQQDPKHEQLCRDLRELPCMKDEPETAELTAEEMKKRAELYEEISGRVRASGIYRGGAERMGFTELTDLSEATANVLTKEAKWLRAGIPVAEREKEYERRTSWNEHTLLKAGGLSFEQAEQRIEEQNAAVNEELKAYERTEEWESSEIDLHVTDPEFAKTELRYGRATRDSYLKKLKELTEKTPESIAYAREFSKATSVIRSIVSFKLNGTHIAADWERIFRETCQAVGKLAEKTNEKLIDDDSPEMLEKAGYITNLSALLDAYHDTPELSEAAVPGNSRYESAYENTLKREADIERILEAEKSGPEDEIRTDTRPVSEFLKLAQLAKGSMANVREAIANEAYGKKDGGLAVLKNSDDIAILSLFSILSKTPEDAPLRRKFEKDGVNTAVHTADNMAIIRTRKQELTLDKLNQALAQPDGFTAYMAPEPRENVRNAAAKSGVQRLSGRESNLIH